MPKPIEEDQVLQDILATLQRTEDNNGTRHLNLLKVISGIAEQGSASSPATKSDLKRIEDKIDKIMATEQQVIDALAKIDAATTKIGTNVATVATGLQTVSDEVDALEAALKNAGVSQALVDQASALGDKVQAASDALDAQVPVLQAIAAKGVLNPVPVPPPPAPPTA